MADPITPPVPTVVLDAINKVTEPVTNTVETDVKAVQKVVKAPAVAAVFHVAIALGTAYGLHLSAQDVAIVTSLWAGGSAYFVTVINTLKAAGVK